MEIYALAGSLLLLIFCGLFLRKLWLGALLGLMVYAGFKTWLQASMVSCIAPAISGMLLAAELALLLFGAYFFYKILQDRKHFDTLNQITAAFSSKLSVAVVLCWFLGSFMEGIAGFGIPAMLIAPMLMALGYRPLTCILLPLAANTVAVTFGALGTPLKIGLGIQEPDTVVHYVVWLNLIPATLLPLGLAFLYEKTEEEPLSLRRQGKMLLGAGAIYAVLYGLVGVYTIEYASVIAGLGGLLLFVLFNVPQREQPALSLWLRTFYPYLGFIALLLIAKRLLSGYAWEVSPHARPVSWYQPGAIFIASGVLYALFNAPPNLRLRACWEPCKATARMIAKPALTILLLVCYAQIIRADLSALAPTYLHGQSDGARLLLCPLLGVFGSFLSGSATMSNIMFGSAVQTSGLSADHLPLLVALLHTGAAIGNAISLQNILMVQSVVHAPATDSAQILKRNLFLVGGYWLVVVIQGYVMLG